MSNLCINHDYHEISDHWQICDICKNTVITRSKTSTLCEKIKKKPVLVYRCKWAKYHEYQTALSHLQWSTCIDITFDSKEQFMFSKKKTHCTWKRPFFPLAGLHDQSKALATSKIFSSCLERQSATITQIALSYTILSFIGLPLYELISIINLKRSQLTKIVSSKKRVIDISRGHGISHTWMTLKISFRKWL